MTRDELSANFQDALAVASMDPARVAAHLRSHSNGADLQHLLIAAIDVAREQAQEITELRSLLEESESQNVFLEEEIEELRRQRSKPRKASQKEGSDAQQ